MTWLLVAVALIGTVLNVRKNRRGFVFWAISNLGLAVVNLGLGQWAQSVLFAVYLGLAVWGWLAWKE
ncbi:nicotinamide mononucleotide transporter [Marinobacter sp.]|uniref:nicotinamide mononucleotide transporter n=1 Tax=Marinobacter sp. TaxID=50741 RepID=UPI00356A3613